MAHPPPRLTGPPLAAFGAAAAPSGPELSSLRIESLSRDERLDLLEQLWDSLSETPAEVPVTHAQQAELDRRSDALGHGGEPA